MGLFLPYIAFVASFAACLLITRYTPKHWTILYKSHVISSVHALISLSYSLVLVHNYRQDLFDLKYSVCKTCTDERIFLNHQDDETVLLGITAGYLVYDLYLALVKARGIFGTAMVIHHTVGVIAAFFGVVFGVGAPVQALYVVNEGSTIFTNIHVMLPPKYRGLPRMINGIFMWFSYLFFRIIYGALIARVFFSVIINDHSELKSQKFAYTMYFIELILGVALQLLNLMWFYKISKGLLKAVRAHLYGTPDNTDAEAGVYNDFEQSTPSGHTPLPKDKVSVSDGIPEDDSEPDMDVADQSHLVADQTEDDPVVKG